jgi:hypothetical protein
VKEKYFVWTTSSILAMVLGGIGLAIENTLIIAAGIAGAHLLHLQSVKAARLKGKTRNSKTIYGLTDSLTEILGISAAYFFTPAWATIFTLASVGHREIFKTEINNRIQSTNSDLLGRTERILVLCLAFAASYFNNYALLYGVLLVGVMALVETFRQVFLIAKN